MVYNMKRKARIKGVEVMIKVNISDWNFLATYIGLEDNAIKVYENIGENIKRCSKWNVLAREIRNWKEVLTRRIEMRKVNLYWLRCL